MPQGKMIISKGSQGLFAEGRAPSLLPNRDSRAGIPHAPIVRVKAAEPSHPRCARVVKTGWQSMDLGQNR